MDTDLLCIVGAGHSGSTLLDLLLGRHANIHSLGEISHYDEYLKNNRSCTCGQQFDSCEFWTTVRNCWDPELLTSTNGPSFNRPFERFQFRFSTLLSLLPGARHHLSLYRAGTPLLHSRAKNVVRLYDLIRKNSDSPVLVDSSKSIHRFKLLHAINPGTTKAIFLTRDGRSIVASRFKRQGAPAVGTTRVWLRTNQYTRYILSNLPSEAYIHIRYEELCRSPEDTLHKICKFSGLPFDPRMLTLENVEAHTIGGNRMRMRPTKTIIEDKKWQTVLSKNQLDEFEKIAGNLNRSLLGPFHTTS